MAGRKPVGPRLVHHLDGSQRAKQRFEVILQTVAGKITIREACDRLGIEDAMFYRLRAEALQAGLARLEPRPIGRPPRPDSAEQQRIAELERELLEKQLHEQALKTRLEIAQALAATEESPGEKTTHGKPRRKKTARQRARRAKRAR